MDKLTIYIKSRGGIVFGQAIISFIAYSQSGLAVFLGIYVLTVIVYETYVFGLESNKRRYQNEIDAIVKLKAELKEQVKNNQKMN